MSRDDGRTSASVSTLPLFPGQSVPGGAGARGVVSESAVESGRNSSGTCKVSVGPRGVHGVSGSFLVHIRFLHTLAFGGVTFVVTSVLMTLDASSPSLLLLIGEKLNWPRRL